MKIIDKNDNNLNNGQIRVNIPPLDGTDIPDALNNDTPTFESIKNHFNSLKKSRHIRKTSSAKSQHRKPSTRSRKSQLSRSSSKRRSGMNNSGGYNNLAYEIEYKNSEACELPIQESSQDLTTSINEDGEYFSKC